MNIAHLANVESSQAIPVGMVLEYLATSVVLGIILMLVSIYTGYKAIKEFLPSDSFEKLESATTPTSSSSTTQAINAYGTSTEIPKAAPKTLSMAELILGCSNVLFLCFGMTGIMILVNNNLARAFAIGAAIAVVRFRVKFDSHGFAKSLFFGVLVGMACGVGQLETAWLLTFAFVLLQAIVLFLVKAINQKI